MIISADHSMRTAGRFAFRLFKAVSVSVAGITVTIMAIYVILPAVTIAGRVLLGFVDITHVATSSAEDEFDTMRWLDGGLYWFGLGLALLVPSGSVVCLLLREADRWLKKLLAFELISIALVVAAIFRSEFSDETTMQGWYRELITAGGTYVFFAALVLTHLSFARFVLRVSGNKSI